MRKIFYYIFFVLGAITIFSALIELLVGGSPPYQIVSGFIGGAVFLFIASKIKPKKTKKESTPIPPAQ